jgi:hypothetical protein
VKDFIPNEEEIDELVRIISYYSLRVGDEVANQEVIDATRRLSQKAEKELSNTDAFTKAFSHSEDVDPYSGTLKFLDELEREIDKEGMAKKVKQRVEKLLVLSAKLVRFRDEVRKLTTNEAIEDLLK